MINFNICTIIIEKQSNREPALYYNHINKKWVTEFQLGCGCSTKKEAKSILENLDVSGAYILEGSTSLD